MPLAAALPNDIAALKKLVLAQAADLERTGAELAAAKAGLVTKTLEIEKLKIQIARLRRMSFGASSERIRRELEQLELKLEELETAEAEAEAAAETAHAVAEEASPKEAPAKKQRRKLPEALPRREIVHEPGCACSVCGGALRKVGEDVTEILDYIPGRFEVIRHVRPAYSCRKCEAMVQMPMPALPIPRGQAGPGLLAHMLVAKFCDHLPLYRQAEITPATASTSTAPRSPIGLARSLGLCSRLPNESALTLWQAASSMPTTRPCRFLLPATARPRPAASGFTCATSGPMRAPRRPPCSTAIPRTAKANIAATIWLPLQGICMPTGIAALASFTQSNRTGPHL